MINELRIGNIVNDCGKDKPMTFQSFEAMNHKRGVYRPTLINDKWLEKLGFIKAPFTDEKNSKQYGYFWYVQDMRIMPNNYTFVYDHGSKCLQYVHELQNLHFALTGNELKCVGF